MSLEDRSKPAKHSYITGFHGVKNHKRASGKLQTSGRRPVFEQALYNLAQFLTTGLKDNNTRQQPMPGPKSVIMGLAASTIMIYEESFPIES